MKHFASSRLVALCAAALAFIPTASHACTACMGDASSKTGPAMNAAIFLMLGCIGFMLTLLAGFAYYLMKRANSPLPPHAEFSQMSYPQEDLS